MGDRNPARDGAKREGKKPQGAPDNAGDTAPEVHDGTDSSVLNRIANSAVGLAGSLLAGPPDHTALAESVSREKGQSSGANDSAQRVGESSVQAQAQAGPSSSFRPSQSQAHVAAEEAAFASFLDGADELRPPEGTSTMDRTWQMHGVTPKGDSLGGGLLSWSSVAEQQKNDGQAVVALLSDGGEMLSADEFADELMPPEEIDGLHRALFGDASDATVPSEEWDNVLNFVPDYLRVGTHARYRVDVPSDSLKSHEVSTHLGVSDPDQALQIWISQWSDVLTRYTDEVWGDLSPLVEQARSEVEQLERARPEDAPPETKALRRLRAILGHLRGQQGS